MKKGLGWVHIRRGEVQMEGGGGGMRVMGKAYYVSKCVCVYL